MCNGEAIYNYSGRAYDDWGGGGSRGGAGPMHSSNSREATSNTTSSPLSQISGQATKRSHTTSCYQESSSWGCGSLVIG
jgi:hypothetical protein